MIVHATPLRRVALGAGAILLGLSVTAGCSSSEPAAMNPTSTTAATVAPPTTAAPTTTLPVRATIGFDSSYDAVQHLVTAWTNGNREVALQGADAEAVDGMWETPPGELDQRGCAQTYDPALTEGGCILRRSDRTGALQVNTERRDIGWVVSSAIYSPN